MVNYLKRLRRYAERPWFSYLLILLFQLKVVWGGWKYRDLTHGDTSYYFTSAFGWFRDFSNNIAWSPLYTSFYGTLLHLSTDVYVVTLMHRLITMLVLAILILALMRRLLPNSIALLVGAWWTVLLNNFYVMYEVHLFSMIPVVAAFLLILHKSNPWARGGAVGILLGSSILLRNELVLATAILAISCIWWEIRQARKSGGQPAPPLRAYLMGYGVPLLLVGLLSGFFYARSTVQFPALLAYFGGKHTHNICQVYAFSYQQRHPEWTKSPWHDCEDLMTEQFGKPRISLLEAVRTKPAAMLEHFLWNTGLTLNGIQVALFNATSGTVTPDFRRVILRSSIALVLSIIVGGILVVGLCLVCRERQYWWTQWLRERALGWHAMLSVVAVSLVVIPIERPRPEYLYGLTIFLMAATGMSVFVIADRWPALKQQSRLMSAVMIVVLLVFPSHYAVSYYGVPANVEARPLLQLYRRLTPFRDIIARRDTVLLTGSYSQELCNYIGHGLCKAFDYKILAKRPTGARLEIFLDKRGITLFYVDENLLQTLQEDPIAQTFLTAPDSVGWKLIAFQDGGGSRWMLFQKVKSHLSYQAIRMNRSTVQVHEAVDLFISWNRRWSYRQTESAT